MTIFVRMPTGEIINIQVHATDTFKIIKGYIKNKAGIPRNQQRLIFADADLEDDRTVADYNIQKESTLDLALRLEGGGKRARESAGSIPEVVGKVALADNEIEAVKTVLQKDNMSMEDFIGRLNVDQLEALDALVDKYEKNLSSDTAIRLFAELEPSMKQIQDKIS